MENTQHDQAQLINQVYEHTAHLLVTEKRTPSEVTDILVGKGIPHDSATQIVNQLVNQVELAKKERAKKDMLYGALWCVGGIAATASGIGLIFWGAILFGGIQFVKGLANMS
ncbi:hypothetical protein LVD17_04415 [Fulvivirga ulvae]|uniref:hypothetical protein n=1 Tax=Fulvivirga ulvae TaxID=2904245 RepID=UPI001F1B5589|nr:hypothetical protein [Fulvivirga ulvae]UII33070.1 hypothetical protein LVD17_04415 [Fulvivirga ulvae]